MKSVNSPVYFLSLQWNNRNHSITERFAKWTKILSILQVKYLFNMQTLSEVQLHGFKVPTTLERKLLENGMAQMWHENKCSVN